MTSKNIDVLLVRPYSSIPFKTPPLGLGYLASSLIRNNINTDIKDFLVDDVSFDDIYNTIRENKIKVIGITCCTNEVNWVNHFISRTKPSGVKIVLGGPHVSGMMEKIYSDINDIDFAICSEGEYALPLLVKAVLRNDTTTRTLQGIPNLIWKYGDKIICNISQLPASLDNIGFPAWELINPKKYSSYVPHGFIHRSSPFASIITTRGCPYNCTFCSTGLIHGKTLRKRSTDNIIAEIEYLHDKYAVREIFIEDDNFTHDPEYVKELCNKIMKSGLKIFFSLPNGICVNTLNEEMLVIMRKANFYSFAIGVESGSQKILNKMKKATTLEIIENKISLARELGFYITGFFIIGYPGETVDDINATIRFSKRLKIQKAAFSKYIPLPGTESYNHLMQSGELTSWQPFTPISARDIPYSPEGISKNDLRIFLRKAAKSFYFRTSIILYHIFRLNLLMDAGTLFKIVKEYFITHRIFSDEAGS